jgi:hypothetical protein
MITPRTDGGYEIDLAGFVVNQCVIDYACTLLLVKPFESVKGQQEVRVRIAQPFDCTVDDTLLHCDPEHNVVELGPVLGLVRRSIEHAWVEADGTLALLFTGAKVRVPPDPTFEAWQVTEQGGVVVVSYPGGEVTIFD